jgi:hypothetical protein
MKRKLPRHGIAVATSLALVFGSTACTSDKKALSDPPASAAVDQNGGALPPINGVSVTVPKGAIAARTELTVSVPKRTPANDSPFGRSSTRIDISFKDGAQPAADKPLDVQIPLRGNFRPEGVTPVAALLYHRQPDGSFRLMPAQVQNEVLHARLTHLSEWDVVYMDKATLDSYGQSGDTKSYSACPSRLSTQAAGQVKLSGKGWSSSKGEPVQACLTAAKNGNPALTINNQMNYLMPIAATGGLELKTSSKDAEEDMVRLIAGKVFPDKRVKGYLGRSGSATTTIPVSSLPATVELVGDPSTFLAESAWFALKFMVGIFVGKPGNQVAADVQFVLNSTEVISCLKNTLDISQGKSASMGDIAELLTSKCTEAIAKALGTRAANTNAWDQFWGRFFTVGGGIVDGWNNFWTAVDGIRLQFNGTISVTVRSACPSAKEFQQVAANESKRRFGSTDKVRATKRMCVDGWAYGSTQSWLPDAGGFWGDGVQTVMRPSGDSWEVRHLAGSDGLINGEDAVCGEVPAAMRREICRTE